MPEFVQKTVHTHPRPAASEVLAKAKRPVVLVLENIRSGNNVGAILRTADAFGLERVLLAGYTPAPPHREILKTSLGAEEAVAWSRVENLPVALVGFRQNGYRVTALEQSTNATLLHDYRAAAHAGTVLILGNEVRGVTPETLALCDEVLEIAQVGHKQSLNVSVAAGVAAYALTR